MRGRGAGVDGGRSESYSQATMASGMPPLTPSPKDFRVVRIVYFSMLVSVWIYGAIIYMVRPSAGGVPPPLFREAILAVSFFTAIAALFVRHKLAPGAPPQRVFGLYVMSFALCEAPALFGLVLHFLGGNRDTAFGLVFASLGVLFLCYPRQG